MKFKALLAGLLLMTGFVGNAFAEVDTAVSTLGIQGYDLVSYHNAKRPLRGNGHYVSVHDGVTYLFINDANKNTFDNNPDKYLPAYGGYCAFGVSVNKKFVGDPEVWRLVDGKLYLNLDAKIQDEWLKDVPGRIKVAEQNWGKINNIAPSRL